MHPAVVTVPYSSNENSKFFSINRSLFYGTLIVLTHVRFAPTALGEVGSSAALQLLEFNPD